MSENALRNPAPADRGISWLVGRPWFWALAIGLLFGFPLVRSLLRPQPQAPTVLGLVPAFSLEREDGRPFGSRDLAGKVWVVGQFDPRDDSPTLTVMHALERHMHKLGESFELVTVSTVPTRDTPEALSAYANAHHSNPRRIAYLTGSVESVGFLRTAVPIDPNPRAEVPLVLVDSHLRIRGIYDAKKLAAELADSTKLPKSQMEALEYDAALLVNGSY